MYQRYFNHLKRHTWNAYFDHDYSGLHDSSKGYALDYSKSGEDRFQSISPKLIDKASMWVTLSFVKDESDASVKVNRLGFVSIKAGDHGMKLTARIWSADGKLEESETEHREISHYLDSIFIGYRLKESNHTGICFYRFSRQSYGDVIQGVYMDSRNERRNTIIGMRTDQYSSVEEIILEESDVGELISKLEADFKDLYNFDSLVTGPNTLSR